MTLNLLHAGSATWNANPSNGNWNTAANWTPATVPNGISDVATFTDSDITDVSCSETVSLDSIVFGSDASQFTVTTPPGQTIAFYGAGVVNHSAVMQTFLVPGGDFLYFSNSSTAGSLTRLIAQSSDQSGYIIFDTDATAGEATYLAEGGRLAYTFGGEIDFRGNATPADANFIINGGAVDNAFGGVMSDSSNATAEIDGSYLVNGGFASGATGGSVLFSTASALSVNGHFTVNGGAAVGAYGGVLQFNPGVGTTGKGTFIANGGKAGAAFGGQVIWVAYNAAGGTYIANGGQESGAPGGSLKFPGVNRLVGKITAFGGANGGAGGAIHFGFGSPTKTDQTSGQAALIRVFGNGSFDQSEWGVGSNLVGSIEGDGLIFLGSRPLGVGSNNLNTSFSGVIQDGGVAGGTGGSLIKTGNGTLVLGGANTYSGDTTVLSGCLMLANKIGSATGTGALRVEGGTLSGAGRVIGPVIVGTANLAPGRDRRAGRIVIKKTLTFSVLANFQAEINSTEITADEVVANGVTIFQGAAITFIDSGAGILPAGTVFTFINNTASIRSPAYSKISTMVLRSALATIPFRQAIAVAMGMILP